MLTRLSFVLALTLIPATAGAEDFPSRNVTIVSPYQAGGTSDIIARVLAQALQKRWRSTVVVENKPGANGAIGVSTVIHAPHDGHTLLAVASSALTLNPIFYPKLGYDVGRDLAPITRTGGVANVLVINKDLPVTNLKDLIELARKKPGFLAYASQGSGSNGHITGEMFKQRAGIDMLHVPYKGSAPAVQDLLGGRVQVMFDNLPTALPLIRGGQLRAIAVTTAERAPAMPEVPTIAESGLPGFDTSAWFALLVAKSTPEPLRAQIERDVVETLKSDEVRTRLLASGVDVLADGSAVLLKRITDDSAMWRDVVTKAHIKVD